MPVSGILREDIKFMRIALAEAKKGFGRTHPNPAVGAVVVKRGRILSRGWHRQAGCPHAEIEAIRALKKSADAREATLYVTLEPCSTHGRTPPCTAAIIDAGIRRVVYGARDPNPRHAGRADRILRKAGVRVTRGILGEECTERNEAWNKWISTGWPLVVAKVGMSLDGCIASPPGRRWITSEESRRDAMELRAGCGAILVGGETVRADNPRLTVRGMNGRPQPLRVVWTRAGKLPPTSHLLTDAFRDRTLVYKRMSLSKVLQDLGRQGVEKVLIEGGGRTLGEAFDQGLVDRVVFYVAPILLGGSVPAVAGRGAGSNEGGLRLRNVTCQRLGPDLRIEGRL
ncbi:MAG: bifunctional diaminohydroxyphosphoribosylaminopyrimidine deaminase/5-amino-6-(5-phosphoribosylamino)uracil reductase RibD [Chthoniobacterales bacterium]|nr:bifunctional diaminohydroxyphosphoribosylaminopyrimidine deaminase/5-amino-6-(5-phosphoribosylamino)uracil reductase RibD [Chthoniobacterales bacterium]